MSLFDFLGTLLPEDLVPEYKWNFIRAGIEIAVTDGLSMSETARQLRAGGLSFTDAPFRDMFRELSGYRASFTYQTRIGGDLHPNPELMAFGKYPIEGAYGYVGQFWTLNPETGLLEPTTFRVDSDELWTRNEALSHLEEFARKYEGFLENIIGQVEFLGSFKNPE